MKGTIKDIAAASAALKVMTITGGAPYRIVRDIQKLRKAFEDEIRIAETESQKMMQDLGGVPTQDGPIEFPSVENRIRFEEAWDDIQNTEIELDVSKIDLSSYANNIIFQNLNVDVDALSAFVDFGG